MVGEDGGRRGGGGGPFTGVKYRLLGFDVPALEEQRMVYLIGASFYEKWTQKATHLICYKFEGHDYHIAKECKAHIVNHKWIEDCLKEWRIIPVDSYTISGLELEQIEAKARCGNQEALFHTTIHSYTCIDRNDSDPVIKKASMFNDYGTPQTKDLSVSTNRSTTTSCKKAFSAGTKRSIGKTEYNSIVKCKRALHYGYNSEMEVTIHEYAKRGLTQLVQIPYTQNAQEMAKEGIKLILLNAYELMTDLHYEGKSLKGLFSSKNFLISLHSKKVKLQDIEILPYSKGDSRIDKSQFITMTKDLFGDDVPVEIICWLECIAEDAPDNVIRHHINMLHANDIFGEFFSMFHIMLKIKSLDKNAYNKVLKSLKCYSSWQRKLNWCILKDNYERQCGAYEANGFGFMQLIRNTFVHPAKIYQELLLAVVVGEQPKFLSDMQLAIYSIGYLPQLDRKNLD